jgi:hypothetical protein
MPEAFQIRHLLAFFGGFAIRHAATVKAEPGATDNRESRRDGEEGGFFRQRATPGSAPRRDATRKFPGVRVVRIRAFGLRSLRNRLRFSVMSIPSRPPVLSSVFAFVALGLAGFLPAAPDARETVELPPHTPAADLKGRWAMEADPELPNVLILGDSISIGYTRPVRERLEDEANVFRAMRPDGRGPDNCGDTGIGLAKIDRWVGDYDWDVIHFNWGLWDLCYRNPESKEQGNRDKVNGTLSTTPEDYERNLTKLVRRLRASGAELIWASTTVVPEGEAGRIAGDEVKYNAIAARVMDRHDVPTNDLHALSKGFSPAMFVKPGDVHFTAEGTSKLADQVAETIAGVLGRGDPAGDDP